MPVNYETYIELHSAGRAGDTPEDMVNNMAKCMGALSMKEKDYKFDIKKIHIAAERFKELYSIDLLKKDPVKLKEVMRGAQNVRSCARDLRVATYGVISESLDSYFNDMKKLVYCKIKLPKVAKQKWTLLQVQIGQSCKGCI